ncbi:MAG: hypothetical protein ACRC1H_07185 [Caldilineaceae bacterium]
MTTESTPTLALPAVAADCPFCGILAGVEPGTVIARDEQRGLP